MNEQRTQDWVPLFVSDRSPSSDDSSSSSGSPSEPPGSPLRTSITVSPSRRTFSHGRTTSYGRHVAGHVRRRSGSVAQLDIEFPGAFDPDHLAPPPLRKAAMRGPTAISALEGKLAAWSPLTPYLHEARTAPERRKRQLLLRALKIIAAGFVFAVVVLPIMAMVITTSFFGASTATSLLVPNDWSVIGSSSRAVLHRLGYLSAAATASESHLYAEPEATHPRTPSVEEDVAGLSFSSYLSTRFGSDFALASSHPNVFNGALWLLPERGTSLSAARHAARFLERTYATDAARHALVVVCIDQECVDACRINSSLFCYGGYALPSSTAKDEDKVRKLKFGAALDALETGRHLLLLGEGTYLKDDPVPYLGRLNKFDLQIPATWRVERPDVALMFMRPTATVAALLRGLMLPNAAAGALAGLDIPPSRDKDMREFRSAWREGISVRLLPVERFDSLALDYLDFGASETRALFHAPCVGDEARDFVAAALGFHDSVADFEPLTNVTLSRLAGLEANADTDEDASELPQLLTLSTLTGTRASIEALVSGAIRAARKTGRSFVPPLEAMVLESRTNSHTGDAHIEVVTRKIWELFPVASLEALGVLPPQYIERLTAHIGTHYGGAVDDAISEAAEALHRTSLARDHWTTLEIDSLTSADELARAITRVSGGHAGERAEGVPRVVELKMRRSALGAMRWAASAEREVALVRACRGEPVCCKPCARPGDLPSTLANLPDSSSSRTGLDARPSSLVGGSRRRPGVGAGRGRVNNAGKPARMQASADDDDDEAILDRYHRANAASQVDTAAVVVDEGHAAKGRLTYSREREAKGADGDDVVKIDSGADHTEDVEALRLEYEAEKRAAADKASADETRDGDGGEEGTNERVGKSWFWL